MSEQPGDFAEVTGNAALVEILRLTVRYFVCE